MRRPSNYSSLELEDYVENIPATRQTPQKTITPVAAPVATPVAAPVVKPSAYKYTGASLEDYLAGQRAAFTPTLLREGVYSYNEGGENFTPAMYSSFDTQAATQNYLGQRDTSRTGLAPSTARYLAGMAPYGEYTDKLANAIGYTGPKTISYEVQGSEEASLHPDFLDALSGYRFESATIGSNDPAVNIYAPDGSALGKYRVGDNSETSFDRLMEVAIPAVIAGMTGGALAPVFGGGVLGGALGQGVASGVSSVAQGGDFGKGFLSGALGSGITSLASPLVNTVSSAASNVGGKLLGDIAGGAVKGAIGSGTGALLSGDSIGDALLSGALGGGVTSGVTSGVNSLMGDTLKDLPKPLQNAVASGLAAAVLGRDPATALVNSGIASLTGVLGDAIKAEGTPARVEPEAREVEYIQPPDLDLSQYLSTLPEDVETTVPDVGPAPFDFEDVYAPADWQTEADTTPLTDYTEVPQQVEVTPNKVTTDFDFEDVYAPADWQTELDLGPLTDYDTAPQQVEVTGKVPAPLPELPAYEYTIPQLDLMPIPEVAIDPGTTTPKISPGGTATNQTSSGADILSLLNLLASNTKQPVLSQALASMKPFDVDSMSYFLQEQEPQQPSKQQQLLAMLEAIGFKG